MGLVARNWYIYYEYIKKNDAVRKRDCAMNVF